MTTQQFWRTTYHEFNLMCKGYERRNRQQKFFFRELYAKLNNVHATEEKHLMTGIQVLRFPGERAPRQIKEKVIRRSPEELADIMRRINQQS